MKGLRKAPFVAALGAALLVAGRIVAVAAAEPQTVSLSVGDVEFLGDGPNFIDLGVGAFDIIEESNGSVSAAANVELRFGEKLFFVGPAIGIVANTDGSVFGYGGIYADVRYRKFVVTPLLSLGGLKQGGGKDLGGVFQFRIGLTLAYEFDEGSRLGARVAHMSSAGINDRNPGEEEIMLTYTLPFTLAF